jgi:hypothetical protein
VEKKREVNFVVSLTSRGRAFLNIALAWKAGQDYLVVVFFLNYNCAAGVLLKFSPSFTIFEPGIVDSTAENASES